MWLSKGMLLLLNHGNFCMKGYDRDCPTLVKTLWFVLLQMSHCWSVQLWYIWHCHCYWWSGHITWQFHFTEELVSILATNHHAIIFIRKRKRDKEYGVSRGVDFQHVDNVVLFDFPTTSKAYIHCIGRYLTTLYIHIFGVSWVILICWCKLSCLCRTARGEDTGTALSFVCNESEEKLLEQAQLFQKEESGVAVIKPYQFKMSEIEGFRYRSKVGILVDFLPAIS